MVTRLRHWVPKLDDGATYWEPFVGAASMFLALTPRRAMLGDNNPDLMACYRRIRARPDLIARYLRVLNVPVTSAKYMTLRNTFNHLGEGYRRSALFIFLNRTCFNGIWRVSQTGRFNVPYGGNAAPDLPTIGALREYADAFKAARLRCTDFQALLRGCRSGDFVYLDPPYPPVNGTSFFAHYTSTRFSRADQQRVADEVRRLTKLGCRVMVSNAGLPWIRRLYAEFRIESVRTTRYVAAGGIRHRVEDIAVLNYGYDGKVIEL